MTDTVHRYARVVVDRPTRALNRPFTYAVPPEYQASLSIGCVVKVPFGGAHEDLEPSLQISFDDIAPAGSAGLSPEVKSRLTTLMGVVVDLFNELSAEEKQFKLRSILDVLEASPFWDGPLMKLVNILRSYYAGSWYESFSAVVPAPVMDNLKSMWLKKCKRKSKKTSSIQAVAYPELPLTSAQEQAVEAVCQSAEDGRPVLLYGVTGSGKTEVYLQALRRVLEQGRQGIVLVPEISLTPQAVERYRGRLGDKVGVLNSALSVPERREFWWAMRRGELSVALGTRSAIFAPFNNVGFICVDEEHESSYKQEQTPRYHARQMAFILAKEHKAALVLGSATPSVESFYLAKKGVYRLVELTSRPNGRELPPIRVIDMRRSGRPDSLISRELQEAIQQRLERGEQSVLLLNRRGFASSVQCSNCNYVPMCPNCSITLTWHRSDKSLICHYCNYREPLPRCCPKCKALVLKAGAPGVERLADEITELFPGVRISRMDRDTVTRKGSQQSILQEFGSGKTQILLGTKMIAKGLDYPKVTLVGILRADGELNQPDFRASERTFQLLAQAAGRAGRGSLGGEVILQGWNVEHPIIEAAARYDYQSMYNRELQARREAMYPPFCRLVRLLISGKNEEKVRELALKAAEFMRSEVTEGEVLGPAPCPVEKIQSLYRWHVIFKGKNFREMVQICSHVSDHAVRGVGNITVSIDPEPQSLI
ncbi:MAG: primosomal protein N' [bacterium]|nr:primosomal protein N' [bacterium]